MSTTTHDRRVRRLLATAAAGVLGTALVVSSGAPASAATPAVDGMVDVESTFDIDTNNCTPTGSNPASTANLTVDVSGTQKFNQSASGELTAVNDVEPTDTVSLAATNRVTGSATATKGAFSKLSAVALQAHKITLSQGLFSGCDPAIGSTAVVETTIHVKKPGTITIRLDVPKSAIAQIGFEGADTAVGVLHYWKRGSYTIMRPVAAGDYSLVFAAVTQTQFTDPFYVLQQSGRTTFSATYKKG